MKLLFKKPFIALAICVALPCFSVSASSDKLYYASLDSFYRIDSENLNKLIKQQILNSLERESKNKLGNRGKVTIRNTDYYKISDTEGVIEFYAILKYHQYQPPPKILGMYVGGGMSIMKYNATMKGRALIDSSTCEVSEFEANVYGDRIGIFENSEIRMLKEELKPIDSEICNTLTRLEYEGLSDRGQIQ